MKRKLTYGFSAVILLILGAFCYYYGYYVKTPDYTLQVIVKSVQNKDLNTFSHHVDIKSVAGYWIDDYLEESNTLKENPMALAFAPVIKSLGQNLVQAQVKDFFNKQSTKEAITNNSDNANIIQNLKSIETNHHNLKITNLTNTAMDNGDNDTTLTIKNTQTNKTAQYHLYMKPLQDGTWQIYKASPLKILIDLDNN